MPELPEVETVRIQLIHKIVGKTIKSATVFHQKTVAGATDFSTALAKKSFAAVERVGKLLIFSFKHESNLFLLAHLKMTGQFFFRDAGDAIIGGGHSMTERDTRSLPNRHTRIQFEFTDGSELFFNDMRLFGYVKLVTRDDVLRARTGFGPEPIAETFDTEWFARTLRSRRALVKAVLLDQSFVAGLGNIYVDEALWRAQIRPTRRADKVSIREAHALAGAARTVLTESIAVGGTTFQHFVDTDGAKGNFTQYLMVFGKQDTPCPRCGAVIKKIRTAGRGTHFCPGCQR